MPPLHYSLDYLVVLLTIGVGGGLFALWWDRRAAKRHPPGNQ